MNKNKSVSFHNKTESFVILDGTRVQIKATGLFTILDIDADGKECGLIGTFDRSFDKKIYETEEIKVQPEKGVRYQITTINSVVDLDKTPVEVPVEKPPSSLTEMKKQLMGEMQAEAQAKHMPTFEEFTDLEMPDDLPELFGPGMTVYEANAEALRQHYNPFRGFDIDQHQEENPNESPPEKEEKPE